MDSQREAGTALGLVVTAAGQAWSTSMAQGTVWPGLVLLTHPHYETLGGGSLLSNNLSLVLSPLSNFRGHVAHFLLVGSGCRAITSPGSRAACARAQGLASFKDRGFHPYFLEDAGI